MSSSQYKKKINESLDAMSQAELQQAWLLLKEIIPGKRIPPVNNKIELERKLATGIQQLDNGEGKDFRTYLNGLKKKYGKG